MTTNYAVAALIITPKGIPLVRDSKKPAPVYWKLPGGRSVGNESPVDTVKREVMEEIGLDIEQKEFEIIYREERESHEFVLLKADISFINGLKNEGDEGEEVRVFSVAELKDIIGKGEFFPVYRDILKAVGL